MPLLKQERDGITIGRLSAVRHPSPEKFRGSQKAKHHMRNEFVKLQSSQSLAEATQILWDRGQRYGCVVDDGALVGIFDLVGAVDSMQHQNSWRSANRNTPIGSLMSRNFWAVSAETDAKEILNSMEATGVRCAPVMDDLNLVGIVTIEDLRESFKNETPRPQKKLRRRLH